MVLPRSPQWLISILHFPPSFFLELSHKPNNSEQDENCTLMACRYASMVVSLATAWGWDWFAPRAISSSPVSSISEPEPACMTSSGNVTIPTGASICESPNSAITASCMLWVTAWKLPTEIVGKPWDALLSGCAFCLWRSRWKRQMIIADKLHILCQNYICPKTWLWDTYFA